MSTPFGTLNCSGFEFKWKIKIDCEEFTNKVTGKKIKSDILITHSFGRDIKWKLLLYPKGNVDENYVSLYLSIGRNFKVEAIYNFFLLNKDNNKVKELLSRRLIFDETKSCWGKNKAFKHSFIKNPVNNILMDGEIIIGCQITVLNILNQDLKVFTRVNEFDDFEKLLLNGKFSDLTVISADGKNLNVHKSILTSRSPVFDAMFEHDMSEKIENVIKIEDIEYKVLLKMFSFIYCGKINNIETMIFKLLYAAEKYSIEGLKLACEECMTNSLKKENAIEYLIESKKNNCANVETIIEYIVKNSKDLVKTEKFKSLGISRPELMYEIVNSLVHQQKLG